MLFGEVDIVEYGYDDEYDEFSDFNVWVLWWSCDIGWFCLILDDLVCSCMGGIGGLVVLCVRLYFFLGLWYDLIGCYGWVVFLV